MTMDIMKLGADALAGKLGNSVNPDIINSVLSGLLGGENSASGIGALIAGMQNKGLGSIADSWLGDGANAGISSDQLKDVIGSDKVHAMAAQLQTDENTLLGSLQDALPQMIDKASSGGSLMDDLGGLGNALGMARGLFK